MDGASRVRGEGKGRREVKSRVKGAMKRPKKTQEKLKKDAPRGLQQDAPPVELGGASSPTISATHSSGGGSKTTEKIYCGGGFRCCIFAEPFAGMTMTAQPPLRQSEPGAWAIDQKRRCDPFSMKVPQADDSSFSSSITQLQLAQAAVLPSTASALSPSTQSLSKDVITFNVPANCAYPMNIRCGSKIVPGATDETNTTCAVRVFIVDSDMLDKVSMLAGNNSGFKQQWGLHCSPPSPKLHYQPGSSETVKPDDSTVPKAPDKLFSVLPDTFLSRLLRQLEVNFVHAAIGQWEGKEISSNGSGQRENKCMWYQNSVESVGERYRFRYTENLVSPEISVLRGCRRLKKELSCNLSPSPFSTPSLQVTEVVSSPSCAELEPGDGVTGSAAQLVGVTTQDDYSSVDNDNLPHEAMRDVVAFSTNNECYGHGTACATPARIAVGDTIASDGRFARDISSRYNNMKSISDMSNRRLPVVGVAVFPLDGVKMSSELHDHIATRGAFSMSTPLSSTSHGVVTTPYCSAVKGKSSKRTERCAASRYELVSENNAITPSMKECRIAKMESIARKNRVTGKGESTDASKPKRGRNKGTNHARHSNPQRRSLTESTLTKNEGSTATAVLHAASQSPVSSPVAECAPDSPSTGAGKSPLFAVALSLPFIKQGNVYSVYRSWVRTQQPSSQLREAVIRNIIRGILEHLAVLHGRGQAHGSIKATNVFFSAHVVEALEALQGKRATPPNVSQLISGGALRHTAADNRSSGHLNLDGAKSSSSTIEEFVAGDGAFDSMRLGGAAVTVSNREIIELSRHVVLADGYYGEIEEVLINTLRQSSKESVDNDGNVVVVCDEELTSVLDDWYTSLPSQKIDEENRSHRSDRELRLFTLAEQEYLPPPECVVEESSPSAPYFTPRNHPKSSSASADAVEDMDWQSCTTNKSSDVHIAKFRATSNTCNPRCPISCSHDIWMLGMLAIQLADGGSPWWMRLHHKPLPRLRRGQWSLNFAAFVQRCAHREAGQRPTAAELLQDGWFNRVLLDDSREMVDGHVAVPVAAHTHQQQHTGVPPKPPCLRAFIDIMFGYHEFVEEWLSRLSQANIDSVLMRCGSSFPSFENNKDSYSTSMNCEGSIERAGGYQSLSKEDMSRSTRRSLLVSKGSCDQKSGIATQSRDLETRQHNQPFGSTGDSVSRDEMPEVAEQYDAESRYSSKDNSNENFSVVSGMVQEDFDGALILALKSCGAEFVDEAPSVGVKHWGGSTSRAPDQCSFYQPSENLPGAIEDPCQQQQKGQNVTGELLQAFLNLKKECRLAADVWCASLIKYMKFDGRTIGDVQPLITDETVPFFAPWNPAESNNKAFPDGGRVVPGAMRPQKTTGSSGGGNAAASEELANAQGERGGPKQGLQWSLGPSPTLFHNYMFCKWCVTTSWALQQTKREDDTSAEGK
ncbi:hypothetical protein ERJ75_000247400 [Trypanosoma vivax]|nr:hypothetical protein ERJ75_000247400 [Trypanosoma vivax]